MAERAAPLAVSMGDPAGIGPDIILHSAMTGTKEAFFVCGDPALFADRAARLGLDVQIVSVSTDEPGASAAPGKPGVLHVLPTTPCDTRDPGLFNPGNGKATLDALQAALDACLQGRASGLVTAPINKKALYDAGFRHPGHTEFMGEYCRTHGHEAHEVMMLASSALRVVPATIHIPLKEVPAALSIDLLVRTARITSRDLQRFFGIQRPRIAFAGVNPHAGEGGAIGREEIDIVIPAIKLLEKEGIAVSGPHSADTMFHAAARARYDVAICMYHDQALIPIKTLSFDEGVNVTLGLPIIRTSPDHGTAYDIAGSGKARPDSFHHALDMAATMAASFARFNEAQEAVHG